MQKRVVDYTKTTCERSPPASFEHLPDGNDVLDLVGQVLGEPIVHCGGVGTGTSTKLFTNLLLGNLLQAFAEAAEKQGIYLPQTATTREAVNGANGLGHGDEDMMAIVKLLESVAETTVGDADAA